MKGIEYLKMRVQYLEKKVQELERGYRVVTDMEQKIKTVNTDLIRFENKINKQSKRIDELETEIIIKGLNK